MHIWGSYINTSLLERLECRALWIVSSSALLTHSNYFIKVLHQFPYTNAFAMDTTLLSFQSHISYFENSHCDSSFRNLMHSDPRFDIYARSHTCTLHVKSVTFLFIFSTSLDVQPFNRVMSNTDMDNLMVFPQLWWKLSWPLAFYHHKHVSFTLYDLLLVQF